MEKEQREWTPLEALEFKRALRVLAEQSGYSNATVAKIFGVSESRFNVWIDLSDETMPMIPTYELISLACESPMIFARLIERRQKFIGRPFKLRDTRGRKAGRLRKESSTAFTGAISGPTITATPEALEIKGPRRKPPHG